MKKTNLSFAAIVFALLTSCGEKETPVAAADVPAAVSTAFAAKYPAAKDVKWVSEQEDGQTMYEAEFTSDTKKIEAEFNAEGKFMEEE